MAITNTNISFLTEAEAVLTKLRDKARVVFDEVVSVIKPLAAEFLQEFEQNLMSDAIQLVTTAASGEMAALAGSEKQSYVVTQLMEKAQVLYHGESDNLRTASVTLAQKAYNAVAEKIGEMVGA